MRIMENESAHDRHIASLAQASPSHRAILARRPLDGLDHPECLELRYLHAEGALALLRHSSLRPCEVQRIEGVWRVAFPWALLDAGDRTGIELLLSRSPSSFWSAQPASEDLPWWNESFRRIERALESQGQDAHRRLRALLKEVATEIRFLSAPMDGVAAPSTQGHISLDGIFSFIEGHYHEPISLRDVATTMHFSKAYLTHYVKRMTGLPITAWIIRRRIDSARQLLSQTDLSITAITRRVGFHDVHYFARQFRKITGYTPRSWRAFYRERTPSMPLLTPVGAAEPKADAQRLEELLGIFDLLPVPVALALGRPCRAVRFNHAGAKTFGIAHGADTSPLTIGASHMRTLAYRLNGFAVSVDALPLHTAVATGQLVSGLEFSVTAPDGQERILLGSAAPLAGTASMPYTGIAAYLDITALRRAQRDAAAAQAATTAAEQLAAIANLIPQLVWAADGEGAFEYVNQRWVEYTGLDLASSRGCGFLAAIHPDDRSRRQLAFLSAAADSPACEVHVRIRRARDGQFRWHLVRATALRDASGRLTKWVGTATDIHDACSPPAVVGRDGSRHSGFGAFEPGTAFRRTIIRRRSGPSPR